MSAFNQTNKQTLQLYIIIYILLLLPDIWGRVLLNVNLSRTTLNGIVLGKGPPTYPNLNNIHPYPHFYSYSNLYLLKGHPIYNYNDKPYLPQGLKPANATRSDLSVGRKTVFCSHITRVDACLSGICLSLLIWCRGVMTDSSFIVVLVAK